MTNTYFEGRMDESNLCKYGRSKEKRSDCKLVVLAAVVNTDGMLVRTDIFEGNRADCSTLQEIMQTLDKSEGEKKKIVVMDAGLSTQDNLQWLKTNKYDYITVMRSGKCKYTSKSDYVQTVTDNKKQEISLQLVQVEGLEDTVLLVDSKGKSRKERSMYEKSCQLYEEGLKAIEKGLSCKGGTKQRDKVNERLGRLKERCHAVHNDYEVSFDYDQKGKVNSVHWGKQARKTLLSENAHGKYLLQTSLDETDEKNIWTFYNVIRTVENTFRVLKSDLDIRPVFHKTDEGTKAHLHLAVLAYWLVSVTQYQLKKQGVQMEWSELIRIMSTQVVVSTRAMQENGDFIEIRQCTEPEEKLAGIYKVLKLPSQTIKRKKFVWHPDPPNSKNDS